MQAQIKNAREKAKAALKATDDIRAEMKGVDEWPSEKQEAFDKALDDFHKAHDEAEKLEARQKRLDEFEATRTEYVTPEERFASSGQEVETLQKDREEFHAKAFDLYLRNGQEAFYSMAREQKVMQPREALALLSTSDDLGGFLVPDDWRAELLKYEALAAVFRSVCRVIPTSKDQVVFPALQEHASDVRKSSGFGGTWRQQGYVTGGTAPTVQNQPRFRQERIPVHDWQPDAVEISPQLLEDSAVNVGSVIAEVIAETKGIDEDDEFYNGDGVGSPEGIAQAGITSVDSGNASLLTYGGLIDLFVNVPAQYRQKATCAWMMKSTTYGAILKLEDTAGNPVIPFNSQPGTLFGKKIVFYENLASVAANAYPIYLGDWSKYLIVERQSLRIQRLTERFAPNIGFLPTSRVGGQCIQIRAFRRQKVSA